ncbi:MAG: hypothetical protein QXH08_04010, partial [Candidatus Hadarchaeales archaeon]
ENIDNSQAGKIRLENVAVTHVRLVTVEPSTLIDGSARRGTVLSGSYSSTQAADSTYEKIGEQDIGGTSYNTETDYEAATQVVTGSVYAGTPANLDADDSTYYEVDAASSGGGGGAVAWYYAENDDVATNTTDTFIDRVTLRFTPVTTDNFLIIASAFVRHDNENRKVEIQLVKDGDTTPYGVENYAVKRKYTTYTSQEWFTFGTVRVVTLAGGIEHVFRIQWRGRPAGQNARIASARIIAIKVSNFENIENNAPDSITTGVKNRVTLTFNAGTSENYFVFIVAEICSNKSDTGAIVETYQGATLIDNGQKVPADPAITGENDNHSVISVRLLSDLSGTITLQENWRRTEGTGTAYIQNTRLIAVKKSDLGGVKFQSAENNDLWMTTSSTWVDRVTLNFTPPVAENYLLIATAKIGRNSTTVAVSARFIDNSTGTPITLGEENHLPMNIRDNVSFFVIKKLDLPASPRQFKIQLRIWGGTVAAGIKDARIYAIPLPVPSSTSTYSLDVRHDSGQVTASQSSVDNIYVKINFKSENTATYTWQIYDTLNTGSVGTTEVTWENYITVNPANYISDDAGRENIRVRIFTSNESSAHRLQEDYLVYKVNYHTTTTDYRLNWEHQVTNIPASGYDNYKVRIKGYKQGSETIGAYIRNKQSGIWELLGNLPASDGWIESTFTSSDFTTKYLAGTDNIAIRYFEDSADTTQDNIFIDYVCVEAYRKEFKSGGYLESSVYDPGEIVWWDKLTWTANTPAGTSITVKIRTSAADPNPYDGGWSDWQSFTSSPATLDLNNRYLQYRVEFTTTDNLQTPELLDITENFTSWLQPRRSSPLNSKIPKTQASDSSANTLWFNGSSWSTQNYQPIYVLQSSAGYEGNPFDTDSVYNIYGNYWRAEKFTPSQNLTVDKIGAYVKDNGDPAGNLEWAIREDGSTTDLYSGTLATPTETTTSYQWIEKDVTDFTLNAGTTYRFILRSPSSTSAVCYQWRFPRTIGSGLAYENTTYDGVSSLFSYSSNGGSTWSDDNTRDATFYFTYITGGGYYTSGWLESSKFDAGDNVLWGTISWTATTPSGTSITVKVRSSSDNVNWSAWSVVSNGQFLNLEKQYLQYRVELAGTPSATPSFENIKISYGGYITPRASAPLNSLIPYSQISDQNSNVLTNDGSGWTVQNYQPIYLLDFTDGSYEGNPYAVPGYWEIYGANYRAENFTVTGGNKTVVQVKAYIKTNGTPADSLYFAIRRSDTNQTLVTGTLASAASYPSYTWVSADIPSTTLQDGYSYRFVLYSPNSTSTNQWIICAPHTDSTAAPYRSATYRGTQAVASRSSDGGATWTEGSTETNRDLVYMLVLGSATY